MEAGALHFAIQPICSRCDRDDAATFNAVGLWFYFKRRGWDGNLRNACCRFWCRKCGAAIGRRVRPRKLDLVPERDGDKFLTMPDERLWKAEFGRWRG